MAGHSKERVARVIAFGASAGGLQCLRPIIAGLKPNGLHAYIVAIHLSPNHLSNLAEILADHSELNVAAVSQNQLIRPDCIHVCSTATDIVVADGCIQLRPPYSSALIAPSIDRLFSSIADHYESKAIGVVLSGSGHDGLLGAKAIAQAGGVVIVQSPDEVIHPSMPQAVIGQGLADLIGTTNDIVAWLNDPERIERDLIPSTSTAEEAFVDLIKMVSEASGLNAAQYKENTLRRQIIRRYRNLGITTLEEYLAYVRLHQEEIPILYQAFLISVSAFFRDGDVFSVLSNVLQQPLNKLKRGESFRVWVPGCATGEEPYSIAIVLAELLGERLAEIDVRIFATDIDHRALDKARSGLYEDRCLETMDTERKKRWFVPYLEQWRINKAIRDLVVFSFHDLMLHPPFIKMDLISCRNLLIYFKTEQQADLIRTFHYSLNPDGLLLLGRSESVGVGRTLFDAVDADGKLYRKLNTAATYPVRQMGFRSSLLNSQPTFPKQGVSPQKLSLVDAAMACLVKEFAPSAVLVNASFEPIHFFGSAQRFFSMPEANVEFTVFALCIPPLRSELKALCYRLVQDKLNSVEGISVAVPIDGRDVIVKPMLRRVSAADESGEFSLLICFDEVAADKSADAAGRVNANVDSAAEINMLRQELADSREHLQSVIGAMETANEELQSLAEELQSSGEELQASNEELQSSNEELTTLNDELRAKSQETLELNEILSNIQNSICTSLIVVDNEGRISRYNELATRIFGLVASDVGQSLYRVPCYLRLPKLKEQVESVVNGRISIKDRVHRDDFHYLMQIDPYINATNQVGGAILTFSDISELLLVEHEKQVIEQRFGQVWQSCLEGLLVVQSQGLIVMANPALADMFGYSIPELLGQPVELLVPETLRAEHVHWRNQFVVRPMSGGMARMRDIQGRHRSGNVFFVEVSLSLMTMDDEQFVLAAVNDISSRKVAEMALRQSEEQLRLALDASHAGSWKWTPSSNESYWSDSIWSLYGISDRSQRPCFELWADTIAASDRERVQNEVVTAASEAKEFDVEWQVNLPPDLDSRWLMARGRPVLDADGGVAYYHGIVLDITERKASEDKLRMWGNAFEQAEFGLAIGDPANNTIVAVNPTFARQRGYTQEELAGKPVLTLFAPDRVEETKAIIKALDVSGHAIFESEHIRKDGRRFPVLVDVTVTKSAEGRPQSRLAYALDISERKRADAELRLAASVFANTYEGVMVCNPDKIIIDVNPSFTRITGYTRDDVIGRSPGILSSGKQSEEFYAELYQTLADKDFWRGEVWNRRKSGEVYAEMLSISVVRDSRGQLLHYIGVFSDISQMKAHEAELDKIAHFDPLTGVPNRRLLMYRMNQAIAHSKRTGNPLAVCYLDLDFFKPVNDRLGHAAGDQLLIEIAERLNEVLRGDDTLARLGGDEFIILLSDLSHLEESHQILERILDVVSQPVLIGGTAVQVSASIGVTVFPNDNNDADTLLRHADQAMYRAKQKGKNRHHFFDTDQDRKMQAHLERIKRLETALKNQELVLYFQPKVDLSSGTVFGAEALIRWQHPDRGLLMPAEFLHYANGSELEIIIGEWVIETALKQLESWQAQGVVLTISVNIGAEHLLQADFGSRLKSILNQHPEIAPSCLELEILETAALADMERAIVTMNHCQAFGVGFSLDDFGTGYSSLAYFRKLPIQNLKIDQSFVRDMINDPNDFEIVESVIRLARAFNREVIAEGVETLNHAKMLLELDCTLAQGYGISCPLPSEQFVEWLEQWRRDAIWKSF